MRHLLRLELLGEPHDIVPLARPAVRDHHVPAAAAVATQLLVPLLHGEQREVYLLVLDERSLDQPEALGRVDGQHANLLPLELLLRLVRLLVLPLGARLLVRVLEHQVFVRLGTRRIRRRLLLRARLRCGAPFCFVFVFGDEGAVSSSFCAALATSPWSCWPVRDSSTSAARIRVNLGGDQVLVSEGRSSETHENASRQRTFDEPVHADDGYAAPAVHADVAEAEHHHRLLVVVEAVHVRPEHAGQAVAFGRRDFLVVAHVVGEDVARDLQEVGRHYVVRSALAAGRASGCARAGRPCVSRSRRAACRSRTSPSAPRECTTDYQIL